MTELLLVPVDDNVIFPGMSLVVPAAEVGAAEGEQVLLVPRHEGRFAAVGTVADVTGRTRLPNGVTAVQLTGAHRGKAGTGSADDAGHLRVDVTPFPDATERDGRIRELENTYRAVVEEILELRGDDGRVGAMLRGIDEPGALADTAGWAPEVSYEDKVAVLETLDVRERLELALRLQRERLAELQVRKTLREDVESGAAKQQREYVLRRQLEAIRKELGESDPDGAAGDDYRAKIAEAGMPDHVREQAERELARLERSGEQSGESSMIRTYLDWLLALPWAKRSEEQLDPVGARTVLDADHTGLEDVKDRIVEYLAVRKLRRDRGVEDDGGKAGTILTLVGPPGTGKTSIGESVARAMGREFVRMSLGGVRDEAEIRGHRRTYVGALPGRLVRALRDAGTMNPVILLDEVDKVGADWRGDPSAALLEVLDPAQNHAFRDHYLDVEIDLSQVVFLATANQLDTIPGPLLDRMEVISFDGYTVEEKVAIARDHLLPRQVRAAGLTTDDVTADESALRLVVSEYTRESGVRQLDRALGKLTRKIATEVASGSDPVVVDTAVVRKHLGRQKVFTESVERTAVPGVATGMAVTGAGGDVLFVEAASMAGDEGLVLTGQLGDVMKESARIALSWVRSHAADLGIAEEAFTGRSFHVHVPAGAIPKDGPSAGVTMATALVSLLTGRPVRHTVAMTGELTLQGRVLPIGGVKQKVLAAHAAGLTQIVVPERNRADLDDVPADVAGQLEFHPSMTITEVLDVALEPVAAELGVAA
ncbi:endopeptidase La [Actinomycetospora sp. TBRC 11914]|uniref:endopeptidase La n=1 Tax=Actinomycetospora sp. TBRC 11914 TaxID=2729387 RepID=UPI00145F970D|nr:endopeptidase La [Actinomycetospora sp. TBRC 11914]NMO88490.1 endopeptidase La [Actinomycetospora sp. TBRC 11914]